MLAAIRGREECVRLLLERDADKEVSKYVRDIGAALAKCVSMPIASDRHFTIICQWKSNIIANNSRFSVSAKDSFFDSLT